jgi:hypothetical protein
MADSSVHVRERAPPQPPAGLLDLPGCLLAEIWLLLAPKDKGALLRIARALHSCPGKHLLLLHACESCLNALHAALPAHAEINVLLKRYWVEVDKNGNTNGHEAFPADRRPITWPLAWPRHAPPPKRLSIAYTGGAPQPGQPHGLVLFLGRCVENGSAAAALLRGVQELTLDLQVRAVSAAQLCLPS